MILFFCPWRTNVFTIYTDFVMDNYYFIFWESLERRYSFRLVLKTIKCTSRTDFFYTYTVFIFLLGMLLRNSFNSWHRYAVKRLQSTITVFMNRQHTIYWTIMIYRLERGFKRHREQIFFFYFIFLCLTDTIAFNRYAIQTRMIVLRYYISFFNVFRKVEATLLK